MACKITQTSVPARPEWAYEIHIGADILPAALDQLAQDWPGRRQFIVTDAHLESAGHLAALRGDRTTDTFVIAEPGEASKNLHTVEAVINRMEELRFGRDTLLIALGGGTVGDLGGFAAAIFKRGVPYVQMPTTTVSQADSAIGGKVGVDSALSKNAYGAFHSPVRVVMDLATLQSLDGRHYRAGLVESIKHAMIRDADTFTWFEQHMDAVLDRDVAALAHLSERNCAVKGAVVEADPEEQGLRRILNFGHTIGHAVESESGFELLHGECVAIGILGALRIGEEMAVTPPDIFPRALALFQRLALPVAIPAALSADAMLDTMKRDKKAVNQRPRFVIIEKLGAVHALQGAYAVDIAPDLVGSVLSRLVKTPEN